MSWKLQTITGEFAGKEVNVDRDLLVGRHQDADILVQSAEVSRKHAVFLLKDGALWVQDLNSSNGTFVNDKKIEADTLLKEGDIVQFASVKFSILQPASKIESTAFVSGVELQPVVEAKPDEIKPIQQPAEAVAVAEIPEEVKEEQPKTPAQQMNDQGMPELTERDSNVQVSKEGMPQSFAVPKPAPIPEGIDIHAREEEQLIVPEACAVQEKEAQKNASVGLIAVVVIVILAILAFVLFK